MEKYKHLREKAVQLRNKGLSLGEISKRLLLSKTTVYYWIKTLPIPKTEWQTNRGKAGNLAMQQKWEKIRTDAYKEGKKSAEENLKNPLFRDFILLYLTEGYRRTKNCVSVANSNPALIKLATFWIRKLSDRKPNFRLQFHEDQSTLALRKFWANIVSIPPWEIGLQRKSNSGKLKGRTWRSEHGVLTIRVGDTILRSKLQAWMDCLNNQYNEM